MKFLVYRNQLTGNKYVEVVDTIEADFVGLRAANGEGKPCLEVYRRTNITDTSREIVACYAGGEWKRITPESEAKP